MNEAAEDVVALDGAHRGRGDGGLGNLQPEAPVRPRPVVVVDVHVQHPFELAVGNDEQVVEAFGSQALDPALGVGVCSRRSDWGADRGDAFAAQHFVEGGGELGITVTDQEADLPGGVVEVEDQVACDLGHPQIVGVRRDPKEVHYPRVDVDHKELSNAAGKALNYYRYDAFGTLSNGQAGSTFGYAGQYTDNSSTSDAGFTNLRARWYQPSTGTFTTRDPAFTSTDTAYTYVGDDPVNGVDPLGLFCLLGTNPGGGCRRVWLVRLRRGAREVTVASELGRPTADHLANQIAQLIDGRQRASGAAME